MNRDKKTGLALGILLVGIVAAFFFRNESESTVDIPQLSNPETVDELIDEIDGPKPYPDEPPRGAEISGLQAVPPGNRSEPPASGTDARASARNPVSFDFANSSDPQVRVDADAWNQGTEDADRLPQPINVAAGDLEDPRGSSPLPSPDPNAAWQSSEGRTGTAPRPATPQTYTVRSGDTMSGLAVRFLGSSRRYMEIYELNRDQLDSPNDLPTGITIRIPPRNASSTRRDASGTQPVSTDEKWNSRFKTPGGTGTASSNHPPTRTTPDSSDSGRRNPSQPPSTQDQEGDSTGDSDAEAPTRRFVPVRRSPLIPRSTLRDRPTEPTGQSRVASPNQPRGHRISQVPPEDLLDPEALEPIAIGQ